MRTHRIMLVGLTAIALLMLLPIGREAAAIEEERKLHPQAANPDGTWQCVRWCGLLEWCC